MPKITKIEEQKKRSDRVSIFIDEKFAFGVSSNALVDFDLYKGKELSERDIHKIKEGDSVSKCLDKAYRFLSYRARSEKEMQDKLLEKFETETVQEAIKRLKKYNLINDKDFATAWIRSRLCGRSKRALEFELKNKGVAKNIIDEALGAVSIDDEYNAAIELVAKKPKYRNLDRNEAYKKIGGYLSRRGYSYDIIKRVINEMSNNK